MADDDNNASLRNDAESSTVDSVDGQNNDNGNGMTPADTQSEDTSSSDATPEKEDKVVELSLDTQKDIEDTQDNIIGVSEQEPAPAPGDSATLAELPGDVDAETVSSSSSEMPKPKKTRTFPDGISNPIVVDASDHVAGRLSSFVAKLLLQGKRVSLVNCEHIMISGTRSNTIYEYRQFLKINSIINPKHGPVHYRRPDTVITKMIRGMLPFEKKPSGKTAHKRLRAYVGSPRELKPFKRIQFEKAKIRRPASTYTTMGELCRVIGWTE